MYADGLGVPKDCAEAVKWCQKAADQGDAQGMNGVSWLLATASDPSILNGVEAVKYGEMAVAKASNWAYIDTLAAAYARAGQFDKAVETQKRALSAAPSDAAAYRASGEEREQTLKGVRERLALYEKHQPYTEASSTDKPTPTSSPLGNPAQIGDPKAQVEMGLKYELGTGVPKDRASAMKCYLRAAEEGYAPGQYYLGLAYRDGLGTPKDQSEAAKWLRKAADQGFEPARKSLAENRSALPSDSPNEQGTGEDARSNLAPRASPAENTQLAAEKRFEDAGKALDGMNSTSSSNPPAPTNAGRPKARPPTRYYDPQSSLYDSAIGSLVNPGEDEQEAESDYGQEGGIPDLVTHVTHSSSWKTGMSVQEFVETCRAAKVSFEVREGSESIEFGQVTVRDFAYCGIRSYEMFADFRFGKLNSLRVNYGTTGGSSATEAHARTETVRQCLKSEYGESTTETLAETMTCYKYANGEVVVIVTAVDLGDLPPGLTATTEYRTGL